MENKKHTYAIGSKEGPVMYDGTVYNSQKQLNKYFLIGIGIVATIILFFYLNSSSSSTSSSNIYTVEIGGTSGTEFTGNIGGGGSSQTIEGIVPATYTITGWPAVAVIQKTGEYGTISVEISKNGEVLDSQSTSASYGVVTVNSG
ncbi:hypothetical protein HY212_07865 [Candidatus Pacearchaeota archaeon]|nr:hypothetical protein [Candidatus Pacearchaeota archaeon]